MRTPSSLFWRQVGQYDKRIVTRRLYGRVRYSLSLELCEQDSQQGFEGMQIGLKIRRVKFKLHLIPARQFW